MKIQTMAPEDILKSNNKYSARMSWKRKEGLTLSSQIEGWLDQEYNIKLPMFYKDYKATRDQIFDYDSYGTDLEEDLGGMAKLHYDLKGYRAGVYNIFKQEKEVRQQMAFCLYSRHRLDPVWNYRKSSIIRRMWRDFLVETPLYKTHKPMHLVLTVPHQGGIWQGKRWYAREIMQAYNTLRQHPVWKFYVYGGEYGVEVKKSSEGNGLHIHIHSLIFQNTSSTANEVRDFIQSEWRRLTGATQIHYETLYVNRKDEQGKYIMHLIPAKEIITDLEQIPYAEERVVRKKFYLDNSERWFSELDEDQKQECYLNGVLECIKYHFKHDSLKTIQGNWDLPLIKEVLNNSKNLKMYNKFGAFYKESRLNYNNIKEEEEKPGIYERLQEEALLNEESTQEEEDTRELTADVDKTEGTLINPFSKEKAQPGEYRRAIAFPERIRHCGKDHHYTPFAPISEESQYYYLKEGLSLKEIARCLIRGKYENLLEQESHARYVHALYVDRRQSKNVQLPIAA